jgi:hypothetical protein
MLIFTNEYIIINKCVTNCNYTIVTDRKANSKEGKEN